MKPNGEGAITVVSEKQKDGPRFPSIDLAAHMMAGSLVLRSVAQTSTGLDRADDLLELLCQVSATEAIPTAQLRSMAEKELDIPSRTYYRFVNGLVEKGFAENLGTVKRAVYRVTSQGSALVRARSAT